MSAYDLSHIVRIERNQPYNETMPELYCAHLDDIPSKHDAQLIYNQIRKYLTHQKIDELIPDSFSGAIIALHITVKNHQQVDITTQPTLKPKETSNE